MNGNLVVDISTESAQQAYDVILDITSCSPELVSFNLTLTSDILSLSFSEIISASSFNFNQSATS